MDRRAKERTVLAPACEGSWLGWRSVEIAFNMAIMIDCSEQVAINVFFCLFRMGDTKVLRAFNADKPTFGISQVSKGKFFLDNMINN